MAASASLRSDSSASTNNVPLSPIPSSMSSTAAKGGASRIRSSRKGDTSKTNGYSPKTAEEEQKSSLGSRARSASLQKGVAVLRALARAPEGGSEVDSGYEDEGGEAHVGATPGPKGRKNIEIEGPDDVRLTEEAKESGRINREGLRKRGEQKEVEKLIGHQSRSQSSNDNSSSDTAIGKRSERTKKKHVLITEKPRKLLHGSIGFLVLYMYLWDLDLSKIIRNLSIALGIIITADVLRLNIPPFERFYESVLGILMRESEKTKVNGVVWYLIGVLTCLSVYPADIACVSVMILSWADTAASVFGRLYGPHSPALPSPPFAGRKSSAGFLAAFIAASLTAALFWATPIAQMGVRSEGLSVRDNFGRAVFGTNAVSGTFGSGWTGFKWGFRPSHPEKWETTSNVLHRVTKSIKQATSSSFHGNYEGHAKAIPLPLLCLGSGIVGAVAEALELGGVDDNFSLPILTSVGIHSLLVAWGWIVSHLK